MSSACRCSIKHLHGCGKLFDPKQHQLRTPHKVPMHFLLGHSIELALKAQLSASGVPERALRGNIGHNLDLAFQMARDDYGFVPADDRSRSFWTGSRPTIAIYYFATE